MKKQLQELIDRHGADAVKSALNEYKKVLTKNNGSGILKSSNHTKRRGQT
jgi:hypothetical protein